MSENETILSTVESEEQEEKEYEQEEKSASEEIKQLYARFQEIEDTLNEGAKKLASKNGVHHDKWKIHLVLETKGAPVIRIRGGAIAEIFVTWPAAQAEIKRHLQDAFRAIAKNSRVIDGFAMEPYMHSRRVKDGMRKWMKEEYGDESEILLDLIPKFRLEEIVETRYTLRDTRTGKCVSVETKRTGHFSKRTIDEWIALSRMVREVEAIVIPEESETPELDSVISNNGNEK